MPSRYHKGFIASCEGMTEFGVTKDQAFEIMLSFVKYVHSKGYLLIDVNEWQQAEYPGGELFCADLTVEGRLLAVWGFPAFEAKCYTDFDKNIKNWSTLERQHNKLIARKGDYHERNWEMMAAH